MKINRILPHFFATDISDEEITQKYEKSFAEILQQEQEKLLRLISEAENSDKIKHVYHQYNPRMIDDLFFED